MTTEKKRAWIIDIVFASMVLALAFLAIKYLMGWIMPFVIGFIIAAIIQKPVGWATRKTHIPRGIVSVVFVLFILGILGAAFYAIATNLVSESISLAKKTPEFFGENWPLINQNINSRLSGIIQSLPESIGLRIRDAINNADIETEIMGYLTNFASNIGKSATGFAVSIPSMIITFIITIVSSCFLTKDFPEIAGFFQKQIPQRHNNAAVSLKAIIVDSIFKMLKAYAFLMFVTFAELAILLTATGYICGDDTLKRYSVVFAFLIAIVDILPVLGTGSIMIPWAIIMMIMGNWPIAVCLLVSYAIITVVRQILEPKVVGGSIGLNPIVTLFFMYLGLQLIGIVGMFLFPMTIICLKKMQDDGHIKLWKQ